MIMSTELINRLPKCLLITLPGEQAPVIPLIDTGANVSAINKNIVDAQKYEVTLHRLIALLSWQIIRV